ncbi:chromate transporter [Domibacillus sp. PGB-M46]|uniref:chromate transporter n=1 Tax=Domibacillus sp. PGB-M46 TaxID=2910255 RepID=UPI001F5833C0|nr:chromate transporter [Domibacillus sp. PGB-M46]MCI2256461.1 chromate transporter [Domibacillus sp. PGB-M46]
MTLWLLFKTFFLTGLLSFGGGYAIIPVIEAEVVKYGWMSTRQFTDIIAVASMSPGPIATNSAIVVGYETAGIVGAVVSAVAMVLPSLAIILIVAAFFSKVNDNRTVKSAFYMLRPIVVGLIAYAAIKFALSSHMIGSLSIHSISLIIIFFISLIALAKLKAHPASIILFAGLAGIALYS